MDYSVTVGASGPASGPEALADLGFIGQLLGDRTDLAGYVRATLGPVLDYDDRRGTGLIHTLRTYFESGANLTRAKDLLHVHVNTVAQRLDRISSLLGDDWQSPDRALEIQLALRLHALSQ